EEQPRLLARGMEARSRRFLRPQGLAVGMLAKDRGRTEHRSPRLLTVCSRLSFDVDHQRSDSSAPHLFREILPTGQRVQSEDFLRRKPQRIVLLPSVAGGVLLRTVDPDALEDLFSQKGANGVNAGPVLGPLDKSLLGAVREDVSQALGLRGRLGADDDCLVAAPEDLLPPAGKPP